MTTRGVLQDFAAALEAHYKTGQPIERHQAGALAHVLRRLLDAPAVSTALDAHDTGNEPGAQRDQFYAALAYAILFELGGPGTSKAAREEVHRLWPQFEERSIATYVAKWRPAITAWLERDRNIAYDGLTREEKLRRELEEIKPRS